MARYLLNSAVITAPGEYTYRLVTPEVARAWYGVGEPPISTIGYEETAEALGQLLGVPVAVDRRTITMAEGDEALVFRLVCPPGSPRIDPKDKGALGRAVLAGHYELGLLKRLHRPGLKRTPEAARERELIYLLWPLVSRGRSPEEPLTLTSEQVFALRGVLTLLAVTAGIEREF